MVYRILHEHKTEKTMTLPNLTILDLVQLIVWKGPYE